MGVTAACAQWPAYPENQTKVALYLAAKLYAYYGETIIVVS
jgi:hypothetical protein